MGPPPPLPMSQSFYSLLYVYTTVYGRYIAHLYNSTGGRGWTQLIRQQKKICFLPFNFPVVQVKQIF
jgi:hypothetical protein